MTEKILVSILGYLGDACGFEYDDLKYAVGLTDAEIEFIKDLLKQYNEDI